MDVARKPEALLAKDMEHLPVEKVSVGLLVVAGSPRSAGENLSYARSLAESGEHLPPILVHRRTMRVIDGVHRLRAAKLRREKQIEVRFFDGDEAACFVLAVTVNAKHGLPLSLADKKAAAKRILGIYPQWSDRAVAATTALHHQTVAAIRKRSSGEISQLNSRIGRDGRCRSGDIAQRRELARELIVSNPDAPLREIASKAGISPATASRVRARLNTTDAFASHSANGTAPRAARRVPPSQQQINTMTPIVGHRTPAWQTLRTDPALRSSQQGRALLQMLSVSSAVENCSQKLLDAIPAYSLGKVAEAASECARVWQSFARRAEQRNQTLFMRGQSSELGKLITM